MKRNLPKKTLKWFYETFCDRSICIASFYREIEVIAQDKDFGEYKYRELTNKQIAFLKEEFPYIKVEAKRV